MKPLSPEDSFIDCWMLGTYNRRLPWLEGLIEGMPADDINKTLLQTYMRQLREAARAGNLELMTARFDALFIGTMTAVHKIPLALTGESHKAAQKLKAQKQRGGTKSIIKELSEKTDQLGDTIPAKQLWSELFARLEAEDMSPSEYVDGSELIIQYVSQNGINRKIKFSSFSATLSKLRRKN